MDEKTCKVVVRFPRDATFLTAIFSNFPLFYFSLLFLPFPPSLIFLRLKRHFFVPVLTFADISPRMNIRWIFLDMQNYTRKVTFLSRPSSREVNLFSSRKRTISLSFRSRPRDSVSNSSPPPLLLVDYSHLVIIAKSAETQKRNTNAAGRV